RAARVQRRRRARSAIPRGAPGSFRRLSGRRLCPENLRCRRWRASTARASCLVLRDKANQPWLLRLLLAAERKLDDDGRAIRAFGRDEQLRARCEVRALQHSETNGGVAEDRRNCAAGDAADGVAGVVENIGASDGQGIVVHTKADDLPRDL